MYMVEMSDCMIALIYWIVVNFIEIWINMHDCIDFLDYINSVFPVCLQNMVQVHKFDFTDYKSQTPFEFPEEAKFVTFGFQCLQRDNKILSRKVYYLLRLIKNML
eukprot:188136_1